MQLAKQHYTALSIITVETIQPAHPTCDCQSVLSYAYSDFPDFLQLCILAVAWWQAGLNTSYHANFQISSSWLLPQIDIKHLVRARFLITASGALITLPWDEASLCCRSRRGRCQDGLIWIKCPGFTNREVIKAQRLLIFADLFLAVCVAGWARCFVTKSDRYDEKS